jgi:hypothetical protein
MAPQAGETETEAFTAFFMRFAPLFSRAEIRRQAAKYVHGLLTPGRRKNGWRLANVIGDMIPDATQRLLYKARWEADAVRDALQRWVIETWGTEQAVVVITVLTPGMVPGQPATDTSESPRPGGLSGETCPGTGHAGTCLAVARAYGVGHRG